MNYNEDWDREEFSKNEALAGCIRVGLIVIWSLCIGIVFAVTLK